MSEEHYWRGTYGSSEYQPPNYGDPDVNARRALALQAEYRKDHIAAGLLAIFLGVFGIHKFYLGYNQTAFIMLTVSIVGGIFTMGLAAAVNGNPPRASEKGQPGPGCRFCRILLPSA